MTKVESLLENHKYLKLSLIDVIKLVDPSGKSKYVELIHKLGPKHNLLRNDAESNEIRHSLTNHYGLPKESLSKYDNYECGLIYYFIDRFFNHSNLKMLKKLHELSSNNLVDNFDLSKINSYEDIANFVTLAEIKKTDKESEKMTKVLLKNDDWLVLRPLTHKASLKYGASTKWCTASENDPHYFMKYMKRGILIYIINMKTGNKTAFFHLTEISDERETSFWNVIDARVDSIETDLTNEVLDVIKNEMNEKKSNWDLLNDEEKMKLEIELYSNEGGKLVSIEEALRTISDMDEIPVPVSENEILEAPRRFIPESAIEHMNIAVNIPTMRG